MQVAPEVLAILRRHADQAAAEQAHVLADAAGLGDHDGRVTRAVLARGAEVGRQRGLPPHGACLLVQRGEGARGGDRAIGERLGIILAPIVAALDLAEVVLAGPEHLLGPVLPVLERTLTQRLLPDPQAPIGIRLALSPQDIVLRGAASAVLWDRLGVL